MARGGESWLQSLINGLLNQQDTVSVEEVVRHVKQQGHRTDDNIIRAELNHLRRTGRLEVKGKDAYQGRGQPRKRWGRPAEEE